MTSPGVKRELLDTPPLSSIQDEELNFSDKVCDDQKIHHQHSHRLEHPHPHGHRHHHGHRSHRSSTQRHNQSEKNEKSTKKHVERDRKRRRERSTSHSQESENDAREKEKNADTSDVEQPSSPNAILEEEEAKAIEATVRSGVYVPPYKMQKLQRYKQRHQKKQTTENVETQKQWWDALRKSINGLINKVNTANIKHIIPELFQENVVRGRGIFCRAVMKAQLTSLNFTPIYAALVAVINTRIPEIGELLIKRLIFTFQRAFKRNDKNVCIACAKFLAHLMNHHVCHELVILQLVMLLLEHPSDDSVEIAADLVKDAGQRLMELSPQGVHGIFERFRGILHEGEIEKRVQYIVEKLFAVRKRGFVEYPAIDPMLDLVEVDEQIMHELSLDETYNPENELNIFQFDNAWQENEEQYALIRREILGNVDEVVTADGAADGNAAVHVVDEDYAGATVVDDISESVQASDSVSTPATASTALSFVDKTDTDSIALRRKIYLIFMSSLSHDEVTHKLLKLISDGHEAELCNMVIECCSAERTYITMYGLVGERLCKLNGLYQDKFDELFANYYMFAHRFETNRLRNMAKFFAHLLYTNAIDWSILAYIKLTEEDTTSAGRIFVKILFRELSEHMGLLKLKEKLFLPNYDEYFVGIFPKENPKHIRFSINYFTSIGLGGITERMRELLQHLATLPKPVAAAVDSSSSSSESDDSDSSSSYTSSGYSSSSTESPVNRNRSPPVKRER